MSTDEYDDNADGASASSAVQWKRDYVAVAEAIDLFLASRTLHPKLHDALTLATGLMWEEVMGGINDDE